jgi:hypothetical protein
MRRLNSETALRNSTRVLSIGAVLCCAAAMWTVSVPCASAQITNESPPPGAPPSGCDYDQRGNYYCWGNKTAGPAAATGYWTAIAYSNSTMNSGASHGQPSQSAAESVAKTNCSYSASDCQTFLSRSNLCLALATSPSERAMGWATDPVRDKAAEAALANCRKNNGTLCQVQAAPCGSDDSRSPSPALALPHLPGVNPIVGCFQWSNGGEVFVYPSNKVIGGPFVANWQTVNAAQRMYAITWPQPVTSKVTISADQRSLTGGNQYGGTDTATRISGSSGLVGTWNWFDVVAIKVTVTSDNSSNSAGTFTEVSSNANWHGKWQSTGAQSYTLMFSDLPMDRLTLTADGSRLSGGDQYGLAISGTRAAACPVN